MVLTTTLEIGANANWIGFNTYWNGSNWKYRATDYAYVIRHDGSDLGFWSAASGIAGTTTTSTQKVWMLSTGSVGIGATPAHQLELTANDAGKPTSSTWIITSDKKTKTNIMPYLHGLDLVKQVKIISYEYNGLAHTPKGEKGVGVIAQDFQNIFPNSVKSFTIKPDSTNVGGTFLGVDLLELFVANVVAVIQLDSIVSAHDSLSKSRMAYLQKQITDLQTQLNYCCTSKQQGMKMNKNGGLNNHSQSQSDDNHNQFPTDVSQAASAPYLLQNNPNPFNQQTNIDYYLPNETKSATLMIFNMQGRLIKSVAISNYGNASLTIIANELSAGMYIYSLIADGKEIDSKRMILTD